MAWSERLETAVYLGLLRWPRLRRGAALAWQASWSFGRPVKPETAGLLHVFVGCFFGFHDKIPWSPSGNHIAVHFVPSRNSSDKDSLRVGVIESSTGRAVALATTLAWNWQQGAQLQWLNESELVFNNFDRNGFPVVQATCLQGDRRTIGPGHLSALHRKTGLVVFSDFSRLDPLLPGYGYGWVTKLGKDGSRRTSPDAFSLWNIHSGAEIGALSFDQIRIAAGVRGRDEAVTEAVSHFQFSPAGDLLAFFYLHNGPELPSRKISLMLMNISDGVLVKTAVDYPSHYCWGGESDVFVTHMSAGRRWSCSLLGGDSHRPSWEINLPHGDGHVNYCAETAKLLIDTYPDRRRVQRLMAVNTKSGLTQSLFSAQIPLRFSGARRCDFHPRWNETGTKACFDSAHTGERSLCIIELPDKSG